MRYCDDLSIRHLECQPLSTTCMYVEIYFWLSYTKFERKVIYIKVIVDFGSSSANVGIQSWKASFPAICVPIFKDNPDHLSAPDSAFPIICMYSYGVMYEAVRHQKHVPTPPP